MPIIPEFAVVEYLAALPAIQDVVSNRVYEDRLPSTKDFVVNKVPVRRIPQTILIRANGGSSNLCSPILFPDLLFHCYGENLGNAYAVYNAVYAALHGKVNLDIEPAGNQIKLAECTVLGQPFLDQATQWERVLATFSFEMTNV